MKISLALLLLLPLLALAKHHVEEPSEERKQRKGLRGLAWSSVRRRVLVLSFEWVVRRAGSLKYCRVHYYAMIALLSSLTIS
jgi:hypothetical protein